MERPTLRQIARQAGVSPMAVSLALRNHPSLPQETRTRLQKLAASLGYQPKPLIAAAMAQMRQGFPVEHRATLALLLFFPKAFKTQQPFDQWILGVRQRADQLGYGLDVFHLFDHPIRPDELAKILRARNILGIVVLNPGGYWRFELDPVLESYPVAAVGWFPLDMPGHHAAQNDAFGTSHLLFSECYKAGYRRIGAVVERNLDFPSKQRLQLAFLAARESHPENFPIPIHFTNRFERKQFSAWLDQYQPDCLVVTDARIRTWLERYHPAKSRSIGMAHWNLYPEIGDWSGADQNNIEAGMSAVDLVVGQIHRGERGLPAHAKRVLLTSTWREGATIRRAPQTTERHKSWLRTYPGSRPVSRRRWRKVDLRNHANRNPEAPGEWFGTFSLLHWVSGEKEIHGVPFDVIDARQNQGRSAIFLDPKDGTRNDPSPVTREQAVELSIGFRVEELYFLHACGFVTQPGNFAHYLVSFGSGKKRLIPLVGYIDEYRIQSAGQKLRDRDRLMWRRRANIQDWWPTGPPQSFSSAYPLEVTADGDSAEYVRYLYTLRWRNPHPRDAIRSIHIVQHAGTTTQLAVLGITALLARE